MIKAKNVPNLIKIYEPTNPRCSTNHKQKKQGEKTIPKNIIKLHKINDKEKSLKSSQFFKKPHYIQRYKDENDNSSII